MLTDLNSQTSQPKAENPLRQTSYCVVGTCEHWVDKCYTATRRTVDANTISIFGRGSEKKGSQHSACTVKLSNQVVVGGD